jgi:hypothetical protein
VLSQACPPQPRQGPPSPSPSPSLEMQNFWTSHSTTSLPVWGRLGGQKPPHPTPPPPRGAPPRLTCHRVGNDGDEQALGPHLHALVWILHADDHPLHLSGRGGRSQVLGVSSGPTGAHQRGRVPGPPRSPPPLRFLGRIRCAPASPLPLSPPCIHAVDPSPPC